MNSAKRTVISVKSFSKESKRSNPLANYIGDYADTIILLGSAVFNAASIALIILVFVGYACRWNHIPQVMLELQRVIAASSLTISSAVMVLVGKRYIYSKLSGDGIRSQTIVLYNNTSITGLFAGIVQFRFEMLSLGLLAFWGLGFATGLTANYMLKFVPMKKFGGLSIPSGSLDLIDQYTPPPSSVPSVPGRPALFNPTSSFFSLMVSAEELAGSFDFLGDLQIIDVVGMMTTTGKPMGRITYPPIRQSNSGRQLYTTPAVLNGFQIAVQNVTFNPHEDHSCVIESQSQKQYWHVWFVSADRQSLTLIVRKITSSTIFYTQYTATAVMMGGTLSRQANRTEFAVNGTTWPLMMSDTQWATLMVNVICNTTDILTFGASINSNSEPDDSYIWTSMLGTIIGSYSTANQYRFPPVTVQVTYEDTDNVVLALDYGVGVLISNIVISIIMLIIAWQLGKDSQLHPDFLNSTRILLDILRNNLDVSLFNQSLGTTVDALGDQCLQVIHSKHSHLEGNLDANIRRASQCETPRSRPSTDHLAALSQLNSRSVFISRIPAESYAPTEITPNDNAPLFSPIASESQVGLSPVASRCTPSAVYDSLLSPTSPSLPAHSFPV